MRIWFTVETLPSKFKANKNKIKTRTAVNSTTNKKPVSTSKLYSAKITPHKKTIPIKYKIP